MLSTISKLCMQQTIRESVPTPTGAVYRFAFLTLPNEPTLFQNALGGGVVAGCGSAHPVQIQMLEGVAQQRHGRIHSIALSPVVSACDAQSDADRAMPPVDVGELNITYQPTIACKDTQIDLLVPLLGLDFLEPFICTLNG